jgi:hypothetical protein
VDSHGQVLIPSLQPLRFDIGLVFAFPNGTWGSANVVKDNLVYCLNTFLHLQLLFISEFLFLFLFDCTPELAWRILFLLENSITGRSWINMRLFAVLTLVASISTFLQAQKRCVMYHDEYDLHNSVYCLLSVIYEIRPYDAFKGIFVAGTYHLC